MRILRVLLIFTLYAGCRDTVPVFRQLTSQESGIDFANLLVENDTLNALTFEYIYNGAGTGIADFNNDKLPDIFFASNLASCRLYLNKGELTFDDVTSKSGINTQAWSTGVSVVDINGDGWMDVYISTIHPDISKRAPNIFLINRGADDQGVPHFEDLAPTLGLADSSYSSQAAFLDYDLDGDLDMYLLTNALENYTRNAPIGQRNDGGGKSLDKLYRHDTLSDGRIHFTDVSRQAGVLAEGWGLGIVVNDFNDDGWPDVYCANDFLSSDHLYINQQDGTFRDDIGRFMNHQEFNGMGADMADLNNDALNDLVVVDMMPDDNLRQKTMFSGTGYDRFMRSLDMKYQPQYVRNVLQRNNGNNTFSDIGYQSGIYATDWSWSALLADFDNDGLRDIFITNGYPKDVTDLDFVAYSKDASRFGTEELKRKNAAKAIHELSGVFKPNFLFHNKGDFQFENVADTWGLSKPSYSNGAAYADLDNDGDLDLVINNLNDKASLFENTTNPGQRTDANFIRVKLNGPTGNPQGVGAKIWAYCNGEVRYNEQQLQRGYLSSVDPVVHIGLRSVSVVDSLVIIWPGEQKQVLNNVLSNSSIICSISESRKVRRPKEASLSLLAIDDNLPGFVATERDYVDYKYGQPTLPHKFSQQGPRIAVGDLNGDELEDFIVGGPAHRSAKIFFQEPERKFRMDSLSAKQSEDVGLLLFDADRDGDLDLYCVSGSSEFGRNTTLYQDRLYRNNGDGKFTLDETTLPKIESSGSCVIAADFDKDNDLDVFVGGRVVPMSYPVSPRSFLLQNDGSGKFEDVTSTLSVDLDSVGMVTDALFTDFDNDGWEDLIVIGEWMPITIFKNNKGRFAKFKELKTGWWNSIAGADFDGDGDTDYIAGNLGKNSVLQVNENEPASLYAKDFDGNGSMDPIITRYLNGKEYPVHYRETMTDQIVGLRRILQSYSQYGKMESREIIDFLGDQRMITKRADCFESSFLENLGNGNFSLSPLPLSAQVSPINDIAVCDLNGDGHLDFLAVNNSFSEETLSGYYDAGIGVCALGRGDGTFEILPPKKSGFCVRTDAKAIAEIKIDDKRKWIITSNQAPLIMFGDYQETDKKKTSELLTLSPNETKNH
jgi:hypothetical protein